MKQHVRRFTELLPQRCDWTAARRSPRHDIVAGITVAVVALPLALAFGVASGMGAQAGLITAVVAGAVAAVFGGSNLQVSGPTGAMTVVLLPIVHRFGSPGVLMVGVMAGIMLIALAVGRLGRYMRYLPIPVVEGFTAGIAVVIALQQVPAGLGVVDAHGDKVWAVAGDALLRFVRHPNSAPAVMTAMVAAVVIAGARWRPALPFSLFAVVAATALGALVPVDLTTIGAVSAGFPEPSLSFWNWSAIPGLLTAAMAVTALAALESLLSATVADGMTVNERHHPDRELFGQGLANIITPIMGGVPATAAIARTAVNVRAGARSKSAALTHAVTLAAVTLAAAPLVSRIPLAALAGVLLATTVRMVEAASVLALLRATRRDAAVLVLTFAVTVAFDLVTAVALGLAVAAMFALRAVAQSAKIEQVPLETGDFSAEEQALLEQHIVAYRLEGPLFFAAAHDFLLQLTDVADVHIVILRMSRVSTIDVTGAHILGDTISRMERRGVLVLLSGVDPRHKKVMTAVGATAHLFRNGHVFPNTPTAINFARELHYHPPSTTPLPAQTHGTSPAPTTPTPRTTHTADQ